MAIVAKAQVGASTRPRDDSPRPSLRRLRRARLLLVLAVQVALSATAVSAEPAPLPLFALTPDAKVEFDAGTAAAAAQDWNTAIARFSAAQELAPAYPELLLNLGLAHLAAGHYVPAMDWLEAYLATSPADREKAEGYLRAARRGAEATMKQVLDSVRQMQTAFDPNAKQYDYTWGDYARYLHDPESGLRVVRRIDDERRSVWEGRILGEVARRLYEVNGDIDFALATADMITDSSTRDEVLEPIARGVARAGDTRRAAEIADKIQDTNRRVGTRLNALLDVTPVAELRSLIDEVSADRDWQKDRMRRSLVDRLIRDNQFDAAEALVGEMKRGSVEWLDSLRQLADAHLQRGNEAKARSLAARAKAAGGADMSPLLVFVLRDDRAAAALKHDGSYFYYLAYYRMLTGQVVAAVQTVQAGNREITDEFWLRTLKAALARGSAARVHMLLLQGKLDEAATMTAGVEQSCEPSDFLKQFPSDLARENKSASRLVAEFQIALDKLGDAAQTAANMWRTASIGRLDVPCTVERTLVLAKLAQKQIERGDLEAARQSAGAAAANIWSGAMDERAIGMVSELYYELGSDQAALWVKSNLRYVPLAQWIVQARYVSRNRQLTNLPESVQEAFDEIADKQDRSFQVPGKLRSVALRTGWALEDHDRLKRTMERYR